MSWYEVETDDGVFEVEVDDGPDIGAGIQQAANQVANPFQQVTQPGQKVGEAIGQGYMGLRGKVQDAAASIVPDGRSVPVSVPNPAFPFAPQTNIPMGSFTPKEGVRELAGMGMDQLATLGLEAAPGVAGAAVKGADKGLTSILRRVAGMTSSDVKAGRSLTGKYGAGFLFSKTKAKPEFLGRELSPKATELASSRVRGMEPEALREIGISSESNDIAQGLKSRFGLSELPSEGAADDFFANVVNAAPDDAVIMPERFLAALQENIDKFHPGDLKYFRSLTESQPSTVEAMLGGTGKTMRPLSKSEFLNLRGYVNRLTQAGDNPFAQAIKSALDTDASTAIPQLAEAKGVFQLSRELPKAQKYLDKADLSKQMQGKLEQAANPKNVQARESLGRLLGDESGPLMDELQAQRLAKEYYAPGQTGSFPTQSPVQQMLQGIRRTVPRMYEKGRAGLMDLFSGPKPPPTPISGKPGPFAKQPLVVDAVTRQAAPIQPNYGQIAMNASQMPAEPITPVSEEAIRIAREAAQRAQVAQGRLPYQAPGTKAIGGYSEPAPAPLQPFPGVGYKAPKGPIGQYGPGPQPVQQPYPGVPYEAPRGPISQYGPGPTTPPNPYPGVAYESPGSIPKQKPTAKSLKAMMEKRPKPKGKRK